MSPFGVLVVSLSVLAAVNADDCDPSKCVGKYKHYEQLGCTPVGSGCCPERFDCQHLGERTNDKCHLGRSAFDVGTDIPKEVVPAACSASCHCSDGSGSVAKITCANIECPELFGYRPDPKCVSQFIFGGCCSSNRVCEDDEIAKLATCELEGKTYKEGQKMYSEEKPCLECICGKGFDGKLVAPFCKEESCGFEIHYADKIKRGCAPLYYGTNRCCPSGFNCHDEKDVITPGPNSKSVEDPNMICKYGNINLKLGDSLVSSKEDCTSCKCDVPPMATCVFDPECYAKKN